LAVIVVAPPQQVHEHGGQDCPLTHAGHAHPQPLEPEPPPVLIC
jgi:hypothetical protein